MGQQYRLLDHQTGWCMLSITNIRGMTLLELMIGIVIVALLMVTAAPSYTAWMYNSQIRTAAESILNGLQLTRAEAVRRNENVQFRFTALPSSNWTVSVVSGAAEIQTRSGAEGSARASIATTPGLATTVTFNGLGRVTPNAGTSATLTMAQVTTALAGTRKLNVVVGGGMLRMCDPDLALPAANPQSCSF